MKDRLETPESRERNLVEKACGSTNDCAFALSIRLLY